MKEKGELTLGRVAKDAIGLGAFNFSQEHSDCKGYWPWDIGRHIFSVRAAIKEFIIPVESRLIREGIGLEKELGCAAIIRDVFTVSLASCSALVAASITKNSNFGFATFLISKFILNGVVHYEMNRHYQKPN